MAQRPFLIKPAGFVLFIQPPLQRVKATLSVPLALIRRADNIKPLQALGRQNAPDLKRKDNHAVVLAAAAFSAAKALESDFRNLSR